VKGFGPEAAETVAFQAVSPAGAARARAVFRHLGLVRLDHRSERGDLLALRRRITITPCVERPSCLTSLTGILITVPPFEISITW
jgi:hypothetical protein